MNIHGMGDFLWMGAFSLCLRLVDADGIMGALLFFVLFLLGAARAIFWCRNLVPLTMCNSNNKQY